MPHATAKMIGYKFVELYVSTIATKAAVQMAEPLNPHS
jgi:hypothetical protein